MDIPQGNQSGRSEADQNPDDPALRIMNAWVVLETALRNALPVCSVAPPTQPSELLSALRINHRIGIDEERRILALRELRNLAAYSGTDPSQEDAHRFEEEVEALKAHLGPTSPESC
jgi:hypothetical protein